MSLLKGLVVKLCFFRTFLTFDKVEVLKLNDELNVLYNLKRIFRTKYIRILDLVKVRQYWQKPLWYLLSSPVDPYPCIMAIGVVEFSREGYKIRKVFCIRINIPKGNFWILRIGLAESLSSLPKTGHLKLIILIFHVKKFNN